MSGGIPSNVPGYLPSSIPSSARRPSPATYLHCAKGERGTRRDDDGHPRDALLVCCIIFSFFASLTLSGSIYLVF